VVYDMAFVADDISDATEGDYLHMADCVRSLGQLGNFLNQSDRPRDAAAARIAMDIATGKVRVADGEKKFRALLAGHERGL
jgi:hypothetical protein